ncbi:MAG: hypothetical protein HOP08_07730 [Cyclobacteriaceae bacterium]|nr:hypothetical protein [Cyclobacteriaceae bacterium]
MKVNKYYPFAFIYFFVNAVGLPFGLLYTTLLTPLFYLWVFLKGKRLIIVKFIAFATPFVFFHLLNGVSKYFYLKSFLLYFTVYVFCYAFYMLITTYADVESIYKKLAITNFQLTIVAVLFVFTEYYSFFWTNWTIAVGSIEITDWKRLTMFTYEPSYYSFLLVPIFSFYFIRFILKQNSKMDFYILLMVMGSLVLSFSMGVIGGLILSVFILFSLNSSTMLTSKKLLYSFFGLVTFFLLTFICLWIFFPENPFFVRISAIFLGADGSANGRTFEALQLSYIIADLKSVWWGIGPGQLKIIGDPVIREFYNYPESYGQVSIPNAFAETFALFGFFGIGLRLFLEIYFFFKTKVLQNYYRTLLFLFIFIYQFTGSFTSNIAEYVIWILAFTNIFPQFDKKQNSLTKIPQ